MGVAEARKPTYSQPAPRELAEQVVDRFLAVIMSSDKDAGWQGHCLLGRLIEFGGELPDSSGFSGFSKVWEQTLLLRPFPDRYREAVRLLALLPAIHRNAVAIDRAYRGRVKVAHDPFAPGRGIEIRWDDRRIALELGIPQSTFRRRVSDGYRQLEALMGLGWGAPGGR